MNLKEFLIFKFGSDDIDVITSDPEFRNMKWDTRSVVKMIKGSYKAGVENTLRTLHHSVDKTEAV